jgi:hypothetical protein
VDTVQISFQVEQAVRGVRAGQVLTIQEWSGLWTSRERYRVGQRMLLVRYPPSKLGLTSPVGGAEGRFAVDKDSSVVLSPLQQQWLNPTRRSHRQQRRIQHVRFWSHQCRILDARYQIAKHV